MLVGCEEEKQNKNHMSGATNPVPIWVQNPKASIHVLQQHIQANCIQARVKFVMVQLSS